ncbi:MAG: L-threonylcarbamoyladenylate synthase [Burkholderiales bacterium]
MQRFVVHPTHPQARLVRQATALIRGGGLVAYPTDSCYALGCALDAYEATDRLRALRGIDGRHPLAIACADLAAAGRYARLDNWQFRVVRRGVPGPYTFLVPATRDVPRRLRQARRQTIGLRVPSDPIALALLVELGAPMLSSSLVPAGAAAPPGDPDEIADALQGRLEAMVDGGPRPSEPSTVVDLTEPPGRIVRVGRGDPAALGL